MSYSLGKAASQIEPDYNQKVQATCSPSMIPAYMSYVPAGHVSKMAGEGYNITFFNTGKFAKQVSYNVHTECVEESCTPEEPLYDGLSDIGR